MKDPIGGIKSIELNLNKSYSYKEIKKLSVEAIKNKRNSWYFNCSTVELGNYENDTFEQCTDENGTKCNFWEFSFKIRNKNRIMKLYLLTTEKDESENLLDVEEVHSQSNHDKNKVRIHSYNPQSKMIFSRSPLKVKNSEINPKCHCNCDTRKSKADENAKESIGICSTHKNKNNVPAKRMSRLPTYDNKVPSKVIKTGFSLDDKGKVEIFMPHFETVGYLPDKAFIDGLGLSIPLIETEDVILTSKCLGRGGFGTVDKGIWLGTEVAVKRVKMRNNDKYIYREIKVMDRLRHPNIINIMAVGFNPLDCYIVMEYFKSSTLRQVLNNGKLDSKYRLSEEQKINILSQVCQAIAFVHELSPPIIHKDIKPENILINEFAVIKLCDMGLSKSDSLPPELFTTVGNNMKGTFHYMAPEIILLNQPATIKADIWALGCVIYETFVERETWKSHLESTEGDDDITKLKNIFEAKKKPDITLLPSQLQHLLKLCFDFQLERRPKASSLLDILQSMED